TSTTPATPTYSITANQSSVNEGSTATFTVSTTNVASGTSLAYTLSGVSASDVTGGSLSGTTTVGSNGQAPISVQIAADQTSEGNETLTVQVQGKSASTRVIDSSQDLIVTPGSVAFWEGSSASFTVKADASAAGRVIQYTLGGQIGSQDVSGSLKGAVTLGSDGTSQITIPLINDATSEGTEKLTVQVENASASTYVLDTSRTPSAYETLSFTIQPQHTYFSYWYNNRSNWKSSWTAPNFVLNSDITDSSPLYFRGIGVRYGQNNSQQDPLGDPVNAAGVYFNKTSDTTPGKVKTVRLNLPDGTPLNTTAAYGALLIGNPDIGWRTVFDVSAANGLGTAQDFDVEVNGVQLAKLFGTPIPTGTPIYIVYNDQDDSNPGEYQVTVGVNQSLVKSLSFAVTYSSTTGPGANYANRGTAVADLNMDGLLDFLVINSNETVEGRYASVTSFLNKGSNFERTEQILPSKEPRSIAVGLLNADDYPDVAIAALSNSIYVLNPDQSGTIGSPKLVSATSANSIAVSDLNRDGLDDLVFGTAGQQIGVVVNTASGFKTAVFLPVANRSWTVSVSDLDGDLLPDILASDWAEMSTLNIFWGKGDGSFSNADTVLTQEKGGWNPVAIDFDEDGLTDVAIPNYYSNSISLFKNNGSRKFVLAQTLQQVIDNPTTLGVGDFDADGHLDLAAAGNDGFVILQGDGRGAFTKGFRSNSTYGRYDLSVGQLSGDSVPDIVLQKSSYPDNYVEVFTNTSLLNKSKLPTVQFSSTSSSANEGNSGSTTVTVQATLSAASTQTV
ncbi:MAG: VCBS repeat-containing protein, partial [Micrococcales bacterium]|nr:VCBS repeat-containing protein [Micrococcales bacterium]